MKTSFSVTVVGMLALGIASNAAVFSIFNSLFPRLVRFAESRRLIDIDETAPQWNLVHVGVANSDLCQWRTQNSNPESITFRSPNCSLSVGNTTTRVLSAQVPRELLGVLRRQPMLGRNLDEYEDNPGGAPFVLLSYGLWQRIFSRSLVVSTLIYGVKATDPITFVAVLAVLAAVALSASIIPARRAAKVAPMVALHYE
jgi:hypothetical protein